MLQKIINIFKSPEQSSQTREAENLQSLELRRLELENEYQNVGDFDLDTKIATVYNNAKMGYINSDGEFIWPLSSGSVTKFNEGKGSTMKYIEDTCIIEVIDKEANILKRFDYLNLLKEFKNNQAIAENENGIYGKINSSWEIVIPFDYDSIEDLNDNAMKVSYNNSWCIIDNKNEFIIPPVFSIIEYVNFERQQVVGYKDRGYGIFDFKGNQIKDLGNDIGFESIYIDGQHFKEKCGVFLIKNGAKDTRFSVVDTDFNTIIPFGEYPKISDINEGMIKVAGELQTKTIDDRISVSKYAKCGFLNMAGEMVIPMKFDFAGYFKEDVCVVSINNKYGYINKSGDFVIEPVFDYGLPFRNGYAKVKIKESFYIIDKTGKKIMKSKV